MPGLETPSLSVSVQHSRPHGRACEVETPEVMQPEDRERLAKRARILHDASDTTTPATSRGQGGQAPLCFADEEERREYQCSGLGFALESERSRFHLGLDSLPLAERDVQLRAFGLSLEHHQRVVSRAGDTEETSPSDPAAELRSLTSPVVCEAASPTRDAPSVDFAASTVVGQTRWLKLETMTYRDERGMTRKWDRAVRTTKQSEGAPDGVAILAILRSAGQASAHDAAAAPKPTPGEQLLLVKQFRPPMNAYTLELPAGLIDEGETPAQAAVRELKEECGYVGVATSVSPPLCLSPGLTNESMCIVTVEVDLGSAANAKPAQQLDEGEFCEVVLVDRSRLLQELTTLEATGLKIFAGLYALAYGMSASHVGTGSTPL